MNFYKKIWLLVILSTGLRMLTAGCLELGNDEVYYQTYAQHLQWNYFDHPPGVAVLIRLSTLNLYLHSAFFIRLGSILCAAAGTWLIFKIGSRISHPQVGWIAAVLYNTSFYTSVIAGTFILPDSPQVIFWLMSMYCMFRTLEMGKPAGIRTLYFILLGISIGLCIMSKVHGIFLWLGYGAFILLYRRDMLKSPGLYIGGLVSMIIILPVYLWNFQNHFITYRYHQGRVHFWGGPPDLDHLLQQVLGTLFYSNPVNLVVYVFCLYALAKGKIKKLPSDYLLLLWLSLPLIGVLLWTSLFNETLPHWSGPAYLSLMLLGAAWLDELPLRVGMQWLKTAGGFYLAVVMIGITAILYLPFRIGSGDQKNLGKGDITLDMSGWESFADRFDSLYTADLKSGIMKPGASLISDYWFPAGHLDHYYAVPHQRNLLAIGPLYDIHHFAWLNKRRPQLTHGSDAYFIYVSNYYGPPKQELKKDFMSVDDSLLIPQIRNGNIVRYFVIYRMHQYRPDSPNYLVPGIY